MITITDLQAMQLIAELSMQDRCQHWIRTEALDGYGQPVVTWEAGQQYPCGFRPVTLTNRVNKRQDGDYVSTDAELRLPLSSYGAINAVDRIQLTARYGDEAAADTDLFEMVGEILPGPTAIVIGLRKVSA